MKLIGLVPQEINFNQFEKPFDICVNEAGFYGIPRKIAAQRAEKYLKELRLWDKAFHQAREMSGGMKRRLMIARAMMNEPKLLILDEPTAGVDIEIRRSMWQFVSGINAAGTTVILTTHYLEEAEQLCRNIAIIDHGTHRGKHHHEAPAGHAGRGDLRARRDRARRPSCRSSTASRVRRVDDHTLEAEMSRKQDLNSLFTALTGSGITVQFDAQQDQPPGGAVRAAGRKRPEPGKEKAA